MTTDTDIESNRLIDLVQLPSHSTDGASKRSSASKNRRKKARTARKEKGTSKLSTRKSKAEKNGFIKYGSLFLLVAQMVGLVLLMRYSRTRASENKEMYLASTAVFIMEVMKFFICVGVIFISSGSSFFSLSAELYTHIWKSPFEVLKLCVPSLLYAVQNNLLYLALTNLDAATYQVCYQLKILTTALFSAILLKRRFSNTKWVSLVILTVGVAIVQTSGSSDNAQSPNASLQHNRLVGLFAVLCAACTSGFSGVYFEKILKGSKTGLWIRNTQMGLSSVFISYLMVYIQDSAAVREKGFFVGYSPLVWLVVTIQAAGGLIVAVVVKYADNVLKTFAASFSIIISCIVSAVLFDFQPNRTFLVGTALVVSSTVLYSWPDQGVAKVKLSSLPTTFTMNDMNSKKVRKSSLVL